MKLNLCLVLSTVLASTIAFAIEPMRLIETGPGKRAWMTEAQTMVLSRDAHEKGHCGGYIDVTEHQNQRTLYLAPLSLLEGLKPSQHSLVQPMLTQVSADKLLEKVRHLSSYKNRYYQSETGVKAAHWIRDQFLEMSRGRTDVTVELVTHSFMQPSVIARIAGSGANAKEIVVVGAHEDSINWEGFIPSAGAAAPGADDDASGVATVLEGFRIIMESGLRPSRTLEFMTYAGEERGLLGSQDIAQRYQRDNKSVVGALQMDMTMFPGTSPAITFINDHVHKGLTEFTQKLVDTYVHVPWRESQCGYGCSDHASWTSAGYPSVFPFENTFDGSNPDIHSTRDTIANLDLVFGTHFVKLVVAFATEMAAAK